MPRRVATPAQLYKLNRAGCLVLREKQEGEVTYPEAFAAIQALEGGDSEAWKALGLGSRGISSGTHGDAESSTQG